MTASFAGRAHERVTERRVGERRLRRLGLAPWTAPGVGLSAATAAVLLAGLALVYGAKSRPLDEVERGLAAGTILNLNEPGAASGIGAFLGEGIDARAAARVIDEGRGRLPNVGALAARGGIRAEALAELKPRIVVRGPGEFRRRFWSFGLALLLVFPLAQLALGATGRRGNPLLLAAGQALSGIGLLAMAGIRDPLRDVDLFSGTAQGILLGHAALILAALARWDHPLLRRLSLVPLVAALGLSAALVVLGTGPAGSDAKVNLWGFQPVEAIRFLTVLFLAGWFGSRWEALRELHDRPLAGRIRVPRREHVVPLLAGVGAGLLFFFVQRDLGPALLLVASFLALYAVARRHVAGALVGLAALVAAFALAASLGIPRTVALRVGMWLEPWENGLARGDQIAHALWAFAAGGVSGTGLGLGSPELIPAGHTDLVLAAVGEELGFAGLAAVAALFAVVVACGLRAAARSASDYTRFLALGLTLGLAFEGAWIAAGVLGLVPLSGVVAPFLSYGRSALVLHFATLGVLWSISASAAGARVLEMRPARGTLHVSRPFLTNGPFEGPLRVLAVVLGALGVAILGRAFWVQVARADDLLARPVLVRQGDGEYRYQDDPRLREVALLLPRGDILDRNGIPLATSDAARLEPHREALERMGVVLPREAAPKTGGRIYPLAGPAWHVLGDLETRARWGASDTAFLERDRDEVLRGYEDGARLVTIRDPQGKPHRVVRREPRALIPLWRHRHRPGHAQVRALVERDRTLRTTLDAALQLRVAQALKERLERSGLERGAAVVVDPENGELLASVSYPWPTADEVDAEAGIDRARFGLYPPGSTFKLVTAAAALRKEPSLARARFGCGPLPGGRVGAIVDGRAVRDDLADRTPHGTVDMELGTVHSCNAYFAQLGMRVGWDELARTAAAWGIDLDEPAPQERRAHLRDASYGQGQVVASPLQMAGVAATFASRGEFAAVHAVSDDEGDKTAVIGRDSAERVAGFMREVVVSGTGRRLVSNPVSIAGKTGTAQVATGKPHAWFVGYAPHEGAGRRIAFAVLLEHGGYGGDAAADVAGRIAQDARALGMLGPRKESEP